MLIGPNGSGKSNLLRALALVKHSAQGELSQEILRRGGITPLLWDAQAREIGWTVKTDPLRDQLGAIRDPVREALTYELRVRQLGSTSSFRVEHEMLGNYCLRDRGDKPGRRNSWSDARGMR